MKLVEAVDCMSASYLERIVKSFTKEYPKKDEDGYREEIINNLDDLSNIDSMRSRFKDSFLGTGQPHSNRILAKFALQSLLSLPDCSGEEHEITYLIEKTESEIISRSEHSDCLKHLPDNSEVIYQSVLETALEDSYISEDEMSLLSKLAKKLDINEKDELLILSRLKHFPKENNELHSLKEIRQVLSDLQKAGLLFYCNVPNNNREKFFVIPEEINAPLKTLLEVELIEDKYLLLLEYFTVDQLRSILRNNNLPVSGTKDDVCQRIIDVGISPTESLSNLSIDEIRELCAQLAGMKKSGTKDNKINEIIDYFDSLTTKTVNEDLDDPRSTLFEYFEELASRDEKNLMAQGVIKKGKDVDNAFENATTYIFESLLGYQIEPTEYSDNPDGTIKFDGNGELLMWDNKSLSDDKSYHFPEKHFTQFKRYIRDADARRNQKVRCFLIIVPAVDEEAEINTFRLKKECGQDTDIAIITASDLKSVVENWLKQKENERFDLEFFNYTGILDRDVIKKRTRLFL